MDNTFFGTETMCVFKIYGLMDLFEIEFSYCIRDFIEIY